MGIEDKVEIDTFHGVLLATVCEADDLLHERRPAPPRRLWQHRICGCYGRFEECVQLGIRGTLSKLYVTLQFGPHATVARTRVVAHSPLNPTWNENFHAFCAYEVPRGEGMTVCLKDEHTIGANVVAVARVPPEDLLCGEVSDSWYDLCSEHDADKTIGRIHLRLQFLTVDKDPLVHWGRGLSNTASILHYSYFKQEKENRLTLYQDAHMENGFGPAIPLAEGRYYERTRCWEDIYKTICGAKHLIYIAGWSIYAPIKLVRDKHRMIPGAEDVTLGELLKRKAEEGVRVLMLVWDDRTSRTVLGVETTGVMHTHDEDTEGYFKDTKVECVLCPRNPDDGATVVEGIETKLMFTHHQKTVVADAEAETVEGGGAWRTKHRRLVAFLGGIDLCDGRYDTQTHSLFRTLGDGGLHDGDFHQTNFDHAEIEKGGPREPWHDVHARVEGPCAWDVLRNFEQRWRKQGTKVTRSRRKDAGTTCGLLDVKSVDELWPPRDVISSDHEESWNAQVFRSIDEGAVDGFPKDADIAAAMGLCPGKQHIIDRSIQDAYISAIRRAQHFIYMENQYFLGSCASWRDHCDAGALQLIPMELTLKIVSKIAAGERFAVYVVVPMWPEGIPESSTVQSILFWQRLTMEMMYSRIAKAIKEKGIDAKPTDYLNFFCLGNRETMLPHEYHPKKQPASQSDYAMAQCHRRFMIYVHAKTMIVDDEFIIVGSANCNQRSMDGARDSEIAIGAYQPHHLTQSQKRPRGHVHGFRVSLWYEHLRQLHEEFYCPESVECVRKVQSIAHSHWNLYTSIAVTDMHGHLLPYPIDVRVSECGDVKLEPLNGCESFPDTKASVLGTHSNTLPAMLTV